ncbi:MAG TPA: methionine gamma-lyase family protein [Candidatus Caccenecus avistercoris]|nr:methionine gamma-lyase family protein [Candidatus Caccenecus avistercoris]
MDIDKLVVKAEEECAPIFKQIDETEAYFSTLVLDAFKEENICESHFNMTTGYGYNDLGRDAIERVFARVLKGESALVRNQFISGSHALSTTLFALLRPNDTMLSITGLPYDTLHEVIGIKENPSSLKSFNINYEQIDLKDNSFDTEAILKKLKEKKIKLIEIQRSRGYSTRKSILIKDIEDIIKKIREVDKDVIIMIDNCYCEMVEKTSPLEVGANIIIGSLIKNLGGSIASNGAYICGDKKLISLCAERLNLPGEGMDVGPSLGANKSILQGLYFAPSVVASSLKTSVLTSYLLEHLGYNVSPKYNEERADIVEAITFNNKELLIKYVQGIQSNSPIDSNTLPIPAPMPGYDDEIIMASGAFTQGSSIELSCDGPLREPYIAYQQGGVTYNYGKIAVMNAIKNINKE